MNRSIFRGATTVVLLVTTSLSAFAQAFDITRMDSSVAACENFYQHANGAWL